MGPGLGPSHTLQLMLKGDSHLTVWGVVPTTTPSRDRTLDSLVWLEKSCPNLHLLLEILHPVPYMPSFCPPSSTEMCWLSSSSYTLNLAFLNAGSAWAHRRKAAKGMPFYVLTLTQPTGQACYLFSLLLHPNIVETYYVFDNLLTSVRKTRDDRPLSLKDLILMGVGSQRSCDHLHLLLFFSLFLKQKGCPKVLLFFPTS